MKNEELLDEFQKLLEDNNKELEQQGKDIAYMKGTLDEMKRHNGRVIKVLAGIITALLSIIGWLVH